MQYFEDSLKFDKKSIKNQLALLMFVKFLNTSVPTIKKPVSLFVLQIN